MKGEVYDSGGAVWQRDAPGPDVFDAAATVWSDGGKERERGIQYGRWGTKWG